jgi:hypothetical protein
MLLTPETVIRWHRRGFRAYWQWKSRPWGGALLAPHAISASISIGFACNAYCHCQCHETVDLGGGFTGTSNNTRFRRFLP